MKRIFVPLSLLFFISSCCRDKDAIQDTSKVKPFHEQYYSIEKKKLNEAVDLFVDYSTCLTKKETEKSSFYPSIHTEIIKCKPTFWSIKGEKIVREEGEIYTLLNNITDDESYADIKTTVDAIVKGVNQAILITDGEYFQNNSNGSNRDNPYLAESFEKWLVAGHDIYIYSEIYKEKNKFDKRRYYFLFTDHDIENNIFSIFSRNPLGNVKLTKLSSTDFDVITKYDGVLQPKVNDVLSINPESYFAEEDYEFQEYQIDWSDIVKYIQNAADPKTGDVKKGGDYVLKGIFVDTKSLDNFTIQDIGVKVYNAYDAFRSFEDTSFQPRTEKLKEIEELFTIDKEAFKKNGEVVLKIHKNFTGVGLNNKSDYPQKENLLKVDIVINDAEDNFDNKSQDFDIFKFTSVDGMSNNSIYESIESAIKDDCVNPKKVNKGILYTIYIKTASSDL